MSSLAFQSIYQILLWHFQGLLSPQVRVLPFRFFTIFQILFSSPGSFPLSSFLFSTTLTSAATAISMIIPFCSFLSIAVMSGLLSSITLSHYPIKLSLLNFLLLLVERVDTTFPCVLSHYSYKDSNRLSLLHCRVVSYVSSEPIFHIHLPSIAHIHLFSHIICRGARHWSYWCGALHSLS